LVCDLENNNNSLVITKNGVIITPANTVGDHSPTTPIPLTTGNNVFVVTETDTSGDHITTTTFTAKVLTSDTKLSSVTMNGESITLVSGVIPNNTTKNVADAGTKSVSVLATAQSSSASVLVTGDTGLHVGDNTVTVKVTAGDGTIANNSFVVRVPSDDTSLSTFTVNGTGVEDGSTVELAPGTTAVSVVAVATAASSGATRTISGSSVIPGNNTLTVLVTAESGARKPYTVTLKVLDGNTDLGSLTINTLSQNMNDTKFTFASTTTSINVIATAASSSATVAVTGIPTGTAVVVPGTTYKLKITVTAQNKVYKDYEYDVRVQSNDNTIDSVYINSVLVNFDSNNTAVVTSVAATAPNSLVLLANEATPATLQYKVENDGPLQSITSGVLKTVPIQQNGTTQLFVIITPEDAAISSKTYTITVYSRSNDTNLAAVNGITVTPSGGSPSTVTNGQTITLARDVNIVTVYATASYSEALVNIDEEIGTTSSSKSITVASGTSKLVNITVTATDGVTSTSYSVTLVAPQLSSDASLLAIKAKPDGTTARTTLSNGGTFTLARDVNIVTVYATPSDSGASVNVNGEIGYSSIVTVPSGTTKVVSIIVTAQDGVTQNSYSVTIVAPSSDTSLSSLSYKSTGSYRPLSSTNDYQITPLSYGTNVLYLKAKPTNSFATIQILQVVGENRTTVNVTTNSSGEVESSGISLTSNTIMLEVKVTAQSGRDQSYTLTFNPASALIYDVALNSTSSLSNQGGTVTGSVFMQSISPVYSYALPFNTTQNSPFELSSSLFTIQNISLYVAGRNKTTTSTISNLTVNGTAIIINDSTDYSSQILIKALTNLTSGQVNSINFKVINVSNSAEYLYTFYVRLT